MAKVNGFFGIFRFLSNFHEEPNVTIWLDDLGFRNVEAAFQAAKTLNLEERLEIFAAESPGQAKKLGRSVTLRDDWNDIKIEVMLGLLMQKFGQAPYLEMLLATGDAELIEENTWGDTFWGICNGVGENWLGKLLMAVRNALQEREKSFHDQY